MSDCTKCKYAEWDCYDSSTVGKTKVLCGCKNDLILPVKDCKDFEEMKDKKETKNKQNNDILLALTEVYVNIKNYDFDTFGNYKMDINEAKKIINAVERLKYVSQRQSKWISVSEKMPDKDGDYIVTYDEEYAKDSGYELIGIAGFEVDCESFGYWHEYFDHRTLGRLDSEWEKADVVAWLPLPSPYKEEK